MKPKTSKQPRMKLLFFVLVMFIVAFAIIPQPSVVAQTCNAGEPTHVIGYGETYQIIANHYGVTLQALAARNGIRDYTRIYLGQTICIPAGGVISPNPITTNPQPIVQPPVVQQPVVVVVTATPFPVVTQPLVPYTTTTNYVAPRAPGTENWCFAGGPWGDGRCIIPNDPNQQRYMWLAGWCNAQVQLGNYPGTVDNCLNGVTGTTPTGTGTTTTTNQTVPTTVIISTDESDDFDFDEVDDDDEFNCLVIYDESSGKVTSLAVWDTEYEDQEEIVFFTDLPGMYSYTADLDDEDVQIGIIRYTNTNKSFTRASAKIEIDDEDPIGVIKCERKIVD